MKCPRCDRELKSLSAHLPVCNRIPLPDEIYAFMFGEGKDLSLEEIARQYGCSSSFLIKRVTSAFDCADKLAARKSTIVLHGHEKTAKRRRKEKVCMCCGILLPAPEQFGLCDDCEYRLNEGLMPNSWIEAIKREIKRRE